MANGPFQPNRLKEQLSGALSWTMGVIFGSSGVVVTILGEIHGRNVLTNYGILVFTIGILLSVIGVYKFIHALNITIEGSYRKE